jgi:hypothetical protein
MTCGCFERWSVPSADLAAGTGAAPGIGRREALKGIAVALSVAAAGCGAVVSPAHREAAQRLAEESMSVDLHSHPGMISTSPLPIEGQAERMTRGKVRAALFCAVGDGPVIGRRPGGLYAAREPRPGELHRATYGLLRTVQARAAAGKLVLVQRPADLDTARARGVPGAILAVEGATFSKGRSSACRKPTTAASAPSSSPTTGSTSWEISRRTRRAMAASPPSASTWSAR